MPSNLSFGVYFRKALSNWTWPCWERDSKISPNSKKLLFKLAKNPKKIKKTTRQYKFFIWGI